MAIDECLFAHQEDIQIWEINLINNETNIIRLEVATSRDPGQWKIFKHVEPGNYIVSDACGVYNFLDQENNTTSRIESVWNELKLLFKIIYVTIRSKILYFFLEKLENFAILFDCVGIPENNDYLSESEFISLDYETNFDD